MVYLITQLLLLLAIASLLSAAIGWLCRRFFTEQAHHREIDDHKRANRRFLNEIDDLRRELTDRNTQVAGLNSKLQYSDQAMHQAEHDRDNLLNDLDELRGLESQLRAVEDERYNLDQALSMANADLLAAQSAQAENEEALRQALADKEQALQLADGANRDLDRQLGIASNSAEQKDQQLNAALGSAADKERQLQQAQSAVREKDLQLKNAAEATANKEQQLREAAVRAAESEEKLRAAENANSNLKDTIRNLNDDIKQKTAERDKTAKQHADLAADLAALQQKLAQTVQTDNDQIKDLEQALRKESDAHARSQQAIATGEEKLKALDRLLQDAARERDRLEHQANDQQRKADELQRDIAALQKELANNKAANQESIAGLERELDKKVAELQNTAKDLGKAEAANGDLQSEIAGLRAALKDAVDKSAAELQSREAELLATIKNLKAQLADERKHAGLSLLSRIKELEAMLDAERRKADEMTTVDIGVVDVGRRATVRTVAANASTVTTKKTG